MVKKFLQWIESKPKNLFLIDGVGALVSAFFLGVILVRFEWFFGIPASILYYLAILPVFFAIYDFFSYQKDNQQIAPYLRGIAILNLLYCCLSIGLTIYHQETITIWGWLYILNEIIIIVSLVIFELKTAKKLTEQLT